MSLLNTSVYFLLLPYFIINANALGAPMKHHAKIKSHWQPEKDESEKFMEKEENIVQTYHHVVKKVLPLYSENIVIDDNTNVKSDIVMDDAKKDDYRVNKRRRVRKCHHKLCKNLMNPNLRNRFRLMKSLKKVKSPETTYASNPKNTTDVFFERNGKLPKKRKTMKSRMNRINMQNDSDLIGKVEKSAITKRRHGYEMKQRQSNDNITKAGGRRKRIKLPIFKAQKDVRSDLSKLNDPKENPDGSSPEKQKNDRNNFTKTHENLDKIAEGVMKHQKFIVAHKSINTFSNSVEGLKRKSEDITGSGRKHGHVWKSDKSLNKNIATKHKRKKMVKHPKEKLHKKEFLFQLKLNVTTEKSAPADNQENTRNDSIAMNKMEAIHPERNSIVSRINKSRSVWKSDKNLNKNIATKYKRKKLVKHPKEKLHKKEFLFQLKLNATTEKSAPADNQENTRNDSTAMNKMKAILPERNSTVSRINKPRSLMNKEEKIVHTYHHVVKKVLPPPKKDLMEFDVNNQHQIDFDDRNVKPKIIFDDMLETSEYMKKESEKSRSISNCNHTRCNPRRKKIYGRNVLRSVPGNSPGHYSEYHHDRIRERSPFEVLKRVHRSVNEELRSKFLPGMNVK